MVQRKVFSMKSYVYLAAAVGLCSVVFFAAGCSDDSSEGPTSAFSPLKDVKPASKTKDDSQHPVASETGPWPVATAEEMEYSFGKMSVGAELDHTFRIGNDGDAELVLQAGQPTCKCTAFELKPTTIKPGEFAELRVQWKGKFKDAKFQHGGPVYTNDPKRPAIQFVVMGIVDAHFDILPEETWSVGEVTESAPSSTFGMILSRIHEDFAITDIQCDSPYVRTEIIPASAEELLEHTAISAFKVKVSVDPAMPPGLLEEKLTLKVNCEKAPITLIVTANKAGPIRILPMPGVLWSEKQSVLRLGQFSTKKGGEAALMLLVTEAEGAEPLQFTAVNATPSYLAADLERLGSVGADKARYKMTIRVPPGVPQSSRGTLEPAVIDIKTNHSSGQSLRIKVMYKTLF